MRHWNQIAASMAFLITLSAIAPAAAEESSATMTLNTKLRVNDLTVSPDRSLAVFSVRDEFETVITPKGSFSPLAVEQAQLWVKDIATGEERLLSSSSMPSKVAQGTVKVGDIVSQYGYWNPFISPDNNFVVVTELQIPMTVTAVRLSLGDWVIDTSYESKDVRSKLLVISLKTSQKWYPTLPFAAKSFVMNTNTSFTSPTAGFVATNVRVSKPYFGRPADFDSRYVMKLKLGTVPSISLWKTVIGTGRTAQTPWAVSPNGRFTTSWMLGVQGAVFNTQTKKSQTFNLGDYKTPTIKGVTDGGGFVLFRDNRNMTLLDVAQRSKTTVVADGTQLVQNTFTYWKYNWDLQTSSLAIEITLRQLVP